MMINLGFDINFKINAVDYPFVFINNTNACIHCGASGSLQTVNMFGKPDEEGTRAFSHIVCRNCGRKYSIDWRDYEDGNKHPVAVSPSFKADFLNSIATDKNKRINDL